LALNNLFTAPFPASIQMHSLIGEGRKESARDSEKTKEIPKN
jgi:hypothetical protein